MAKREHNKEGFGEAETELMASPLNFQLNGDGTTKEPCKLLPEDESKVVYNPSDPINLTHRKGEK